jgi:hypothetical protein
MTMADVLAVALVILGLMATLPAQWLLARALLPGAVDRARERLVSRPILCVLAGLVPAALGIGVALALLGQGGPPLKLLGFVLFAGTILVAAVGMAGLATAVGERLPSAADAGRPWRGLVRGAVCLELAFLVPFIGWFGLLPIALAAALGAAVLSLAAAAAAPPASPAPVPPGPAA